MTTCAVSWTTNVFPILKSTGNGQCASAACHGGASSPTITDADPAGTYATLAAYAVNGIRYIVAGDANPAHSSIECNLGITTPSCGLLAMPQPPGTLSAADRQTIDTWVRCGMPQN
jgi:hypothetical protein